MMCAYMDKKLDAALRKSFSDADLKLDMGKSCIRFTNADELPLAAIDKLIRKITLKKFLQSYEFSRA